MEDNTKLNLTDIKKSNKQDKTLLKLEVSLKRGDFYEAHQIYRSVCNRFYNQGNYGKAIELLYNGALKLLKYEQYASASDLAIYLIKAYESSKTPVNEESIDRLKNIVYGFPQTEKARSFLITEALYWNIKWGINKSGEPLFHDFLGELYDHEGEFEKAEPHYIFGSDATGEKYGEFLYKNAQSVTPLDFGYFLARGILSKLIIGNATSAIKTKEKFISLLKQNQEQVSINQKDSSDSSFVETNIPLINFIQLLCIVIAKDGSRDLFVKLRNQYQNQFKTELYDFTEYLDKIGELYFGIRIHKPVNFVQTLMESMFNSNTDQKSLPINSTAHDDQDLD